MGKIRQFPDFKSKAIKGANLFITLGWLFAIIALFFLPPLFGVLGIIMGIIANKKGHRGGIAIIAASILMYAVGNFTWSILSIFLRMFLGVFLLSNS